MMDTFDTLYVRVAGVTYEGRQKYLKRLKGDEPVRIEPEPSNPYDPNALAVKIAMTDGVKHVGYVPRDLAKQIAPLLDGENLMVVIDSVTGGFLLEDGSIANYGLVLRVELPSIDLDAEDVPF